uniref:Secreted protein n=1 Tax=Haemonchus placei TaxID=6290 RepID=A0A0N4WFQ5_HAEPC
MHIVAYLLPFIVFSVHHNLLFHFLLLLHTSRPCSRELIIFHQSLSLITIALVKYNPLAIFAVSESNENSLTIPSCRPHSPLPLNATYSLFTIKTLDQHMTFMKNLSNSSIFQSPIIDLYGIRQ